MKQYKEKLLSDEWNEKRLIILERDNFSCRKCKSRGVTLHVHHEIYLKDKNPWQYPNKHLITLCDTCHSWIHGSEEVPVLNELKNVKNLKAKSKKKRIDINKMEDMLRPSDAVLNDRYKQSDNLPRTKALPDMYIPKAPKFIGPKRKKKK